MKKVIVLGAGISGLATSWFLKKKYKDEIALTIIEKEERVGGWIRTEKIGNFLFEKGPRGFRFDEKGEKTAALVEELRLKEELIPARAQQRFLLINKKLVPIGLSLLLQCQVFKGLWKDLFASPCQNSDETISSFCARHCGKKWADTLIDPLVRGIFCGKSDELSVKSCFPFLWQLDQQKKSVMKAMLIPKKRKKGSSLLSFKNGMEMLPIALGEKLKEHLKLSSPVQKLTFRENQMIVELPHETLIADHLISTLPLHTLCKIWKEAPPELAQVKYNSLAVASFGWYGKKLKKKGYGFLVPSRENEKIYGISWDSSIFPDQNQGAMTRVCVMLPPSSEDTLRQTALEYIDHVLGIDVTPAAQSISIAAQAIPQYHLNYEQKIAEALKQLPPTLQLKGTFYGGVGINDCIASASQITIL